MVLTTLPLPTTVTLPFVPLQVLHVPSVPLLLLYALGVRTNPSMLAAALLPLSVVEEFPSAAMMAQAMAVQCQRENHTGDDPASGSNSSSSIGRWEALKDGLP